MCISPVDIVDRSEVACKPVAYCLLTLEAGALLTPYPAANTRMASSLVVWSEGIKEALLYLELSIQTSGETTRHSATKCQFDHPRQARDSQDRAHGALEQSC